MLFIWLFVWLASSTPEVEFKDNWNNWAIALVVCGVIDVLYYVKRRV